MESGAVLTTIENSPELQDVLAAFAGKHDVHSVGESLVPFAESGNQISIAAIVALRQVFRLRDGRLLAKPHWIDENTGELSVETALDLPALQALIEASNASPLLAGHIGHLLWSVAPSKVSAGAANGAIEGLKVLAGDASIEPAKRYQFAVQLFHLARRRSNDVGREHALSSLRVALDEAALDAATQANGFILIAEQLFSLGYDRAWLAERLTLMLPALKQDPGPRQQVAILLARCSPLERAAVITAELNLELAEAEAQRGFRRQDTLNRILQVAREHGLRDCAGAASKQLAAISVADYDLKEHIIDYTLPDEEFARAEATFELFRDGNPEVELWRRWAGLFPPFVPIHQRDPNPFRLADAIATLQLISPHGHVMFQPDTPDEVALFRFMESDLQHLQYIFATHTQPASAVLFFRPDMIAILHCLIDASPLFSEKGKMRLHSAVIAFKARDWDGVADTLPTIETGFRSIADSLGISIYVPNGNANMFKTLGGLLSEISSQKPELQRLSQFWKFVLTEQLGLNVRNEYAHGIDESPGDFLATCLMQIYVQLLCVTTGIQDCNPDTTTRLGQA